MSWALGSPTRWASSTTCWPRAAAGAKGGPRLEGDQRLLQQAHEHIVGCLGELVGPEALAVPDRRRGEAVRVPQAPGDRRRLGEALPRLGGVPGSPLGLPEGE